MAQKPIQLEIKGIPDKCPTFKSLWDEGVIAPGKMELYTDLKIPEEDEDDDDPKNKKKGKPKKSFEVDRRKIQKAAKDRMDEIKDKIVEAFEEALKVVKDCHKGPSQDFKRAKDAIDKVNKLIEELLEDAPTEVREAVSRKTKIPADEMSTVNDLNFKKASIVRGAFKGDNAEDLDDPPDYSKELKGLWSGKSGGKAEPIDCILFSDKELTMVLLGIDERVKPADWKDYFAKQPTVVEGKFTPDSSPNSITLDSKLKSKKNDVTKALKEQCNFAIKVQ